MYKKTLKKETDLHHEITFYDLMKAIGKQKVSSDKVIGNIEEDLVWLDIDKIENELVYPQTDKYILKAISSGAINAIVNEK